MVRDELVDGEVPRDLSSDLLVVLDKYVDLGKVELRSLRLLSLSQEIRLVGYFCYTSPVEPFI